MPAPLLPPRSPRAAALGAPTSPPEAAGRGAEPEAEAPPAEPPMSNDGWVGPWRPHRPRGPLSAAYRNPGPKCGTPSGIGERGAEGSAGDRSRGGRVPSGRCPALSRDLRDPSGRRAPAYSFGMRLGGPEEPRSPGPQYLVPAGFTARGRDRGPAFTMGGRFHERRASNTPGPAHYSPERANRVTLPSAPACSMRSRGRGDKPPQTPGPATYQLPPVVGPRLVNKTSTPQYTMTGRGPSIFDDKKKTPGPNNYGTVDTNLYMARAPRCTIVGRTRPPTTSKTPSPSDYYPKQDQKQGQTFGVRHSECVVPVMDLHL
ncbi:outer dense fiber protein 3B isoform X1 [Vidua macroura]|uniref:outer dense fiber protein 3B isoform X1 n=1 Tax=Vidua macroura TaxID=187451 RepID=UPI0023A7F073|nr:outer dense fiber protein 3B isoform X1 [Vidua macroura]